MNPRGLLTRAWSRPERLGGQGVRGRDTEIHRLRTRPRKGGEGSPGRAAGLAPTAAVRTASLPRRSLRGPNSTPAEGRGGDRRGDAGDAGVGGWAPERGRGPDLCLPPPRGSPSRPETGPRAAKSQWGRSGQRLRRRKPPPPGAVRSRESCRALPAPPRPRRGCRHSRPPPARAPPAPCAHFSLAHCRLPASPPPPASSPAPHSAPPFSRVLGAHPPAMAWAWDQERCGALPKPG